MSRSGSTLAGGMLLGLTREKAARFSFLMSIPLIIGASLFKILETLEGDISSLGFDTLAIGFLSSFIVGYIAIRYLLKFLKTSTLNIFIVYRVVLGIFLLLISSII